MTHLEVFINSLDCDNTKINYKHDIESMLQYVNKPVTDIHYLDLLQWTTYLKFFATSTQARRIAAVKSYFDFLEMTEIITKNPARHLKSPTVVNKEKPVLFKEEAVKLIDATRNAREKAIVAVYLSTGLRVSELINLKLTDLDNDKLVIKTKGNKNRVLFLNEQCKQFIQDYLLERKNSGIENLFVSNSGQPLRRECISQMLKKLAKRAGIDKDISNHSMRHAFVTSIAEQYNIQLASTVVGHSSIAVTQRYVHQKEKTIQEVMQNIVLV